MLVEWLMSKSSPSGCSRRGLSCGEPHHSASRYESYDTVGPASDAGCEGIEATGLEVQMRRTWMYFVFAAAMSMLIACGSSGFDNIIEYTTFHVGLNDHVQAFMKVRDEYLSEPWPAWTAIGITELALSGARVEIRVTAQK